jgi:hypothetical protein
MMRMTILSIDSLYPPRLCKVEFVTSDDECHARLLRVRFLHLRFAYNVRDIILLFNYNAAPIL